MLRDDGGIMTQRPREGLGVEGKQAQESSAGEAEPSEWGQAPQREAAHRGKGADTRQCISERRIKRVSGARERREGKTKG